MDNFLHGGEYPETEGVRSEPCSSCAFGNGAATVRTSDITITELVEQTADLDDFVCHTAECGKSRTCKRWHDAHRRPLRRATCRARACHTGYISMSTAPFKKQITSK